MDIIYENDRFFRCCKYGVGNYCCRPTVTQLNMEFSNEKNQAHEELLWRH